MLNKYFYCVGTYVYEDVAHKEHTAFTDGVYPLKHKNLNLTDLKQIKTSLITNVVERFHNRKIIEFALTSVVALGEQEEAELIAGSANPNSIKELYE